MAKRQKAITQGAVWPKVQGAELEIGDLVLVQTDCLEGQTQNTG